MDAILFLHFYNIFEFYFYYINDDDDDDDYHIDVSEFEHNALVMMSMMMKVHYRLLKDTHSMNYQYKNVLIHYKILHVNKSVHL
jgi:hypothetical protein